jgi:hypothetical protein
MQREKINSFLYYPEVLELHRFLRPYAEIELKGIPPSLKQRAVTVPKEKSRRTADFSSSFDAAKTKKRKASDDKIATKEQFGKEHVSYYDEENRGRTKAEKELSREEEKDKNLEILANLKQNKIKDLKDFKKPTKKVEP